MNPLGTVDVEVRANLTTLDRGLDRSEARVNEYDRSVTGSFAHVEEAARSAGEETTRALDGGARATKEAARAMEEMSASSRTVSNELESAAQQEDRLTQMVRRSVQAYEERRAAVEAVAEAEESRRVAMHGQSWEPRLSLEEFVRQEQAAEAAAEAQKKLAEATARTDQEAEKLRRSLDPLYAAQRKYDDEVDRAAELLRRGAISQEEFNAAVAKAEGDLKGAEAALRGVGAANPQITRLGRSIGILSSQAATGGIQLRSFSGFLRQGVGTSIALRGALGGLGGVVGGVGAAVAAGTIAWQQYNTAVNDAENALRGIGRASGVSIGVLQELAAASADSANITERSAQRMATAYIRAGVQGRDTIQGLIEITGDYAAVTGQDAAQAQAELARAMRDPEQGLRILEQRMGAFDQETRRNIQTLLDQGRTLEASNALFRAMQGEVEGAADNLNSLQRAFRDAKNAAVDFWDAMGRSLNVNLGGGTTQDRIRVISEREEGQGVGARLGRALRSPRGRERDQAELTRLRALEATEQAAADARAAEERLNSERQRANELVQAALPWERQRAEVTNRMTQIRRDAAAGLITEQQATAALRAEQVRLNQIQETAGRDGARRGRSGGRSREENLRRQAEAMDENARQALILADAYLESGEAAMRAEAARRALTDATRRGIDAEAQMRRQLALAVAEAAVQGAQQVASAREQADALQTVNDAVQSGARSYEDAARAAEIDAALRPLMIAQAVAEGAAREQITEIIDAQREALQELQQQEARGEAIRARASVERDIQMMELELQLIGKTNAERRTAIAQLQAMQQLRQWGVSPDSAEGASFLESILGAADLESRLEVGEWMDESTRRIREQIQAFEDEATVIGMTFREAERFRMEQELLAQAQAQGIELTDEHRASIASLSEAYADAAEQSRLMHEQMRALEEASTFAAQSFAGFFEELVWGSGSAEDALRNLVRSLGQAMFQAFALGQGPLAGILGTANTGKVGGGAGGVLAGIGRSLFGRFFNAPVAHSGLKPGGAAASSRMVPQAMFLNAPRLHEGLRADEFPAILQRGEEVVPRGGRRGGSPIYINVSTPDANSFMRSDRQIGRLLKQRLQL